MGREDDFTLNFLGPMKQSFENDHSTFSEWEENYKGFHIFSHFQCGINIKGFPSWPDETIIRQFMVVQLPLNL